MVGPTPEWEWQSQAEQQAVIPFLMRQDRSRNARPEVKQSLRRTPGTA